MKKFIRLWFGGSEKICIPCGRINPPDYSICIGCGRGLS